MGKSESKSLEALRRKLKEQSPYIIPGTSRRTLSKEEKATFLDDLAMPALRSIEKELKAFRLQTIVQKFASISKLTVKEKSCAFHYKVEVDNSLGVVQLHFNYESRSAYLDFTHGIDYEGFRIDLNELAKVDEELITDKFIEFYFDAERLVADIANREREERDVKASRILKQFRENRKEFESEERFLETVVKIENEIRNGK